MIASYLDKNDNLDLQAFLKNGIENFPPGQSIALQKMRVKIGIFKYLKILG